MTNISLGEIAARYGCELRGDPVIRVVQVATLGGADRQSVSFLTNKLFRLQLETTGAGAVILSEEFVDARPTAALISSNPYAVYTRGATDRWRKDRR